MGTRLTIIKLAQGVSAVMTVCQTEGRLDWKIQMYTTTLYIEKYPGDSNTTGLVSETRKHGLEWN